jgi:hypothetical protein
MNRYTKRSNKKQKRIRRKTNKNDKQQICNYFGGNIDVLNQEDTNANGGKGYKKKHTSSTFKPMNCNPKAKKHAIIKGSCLTDDALQKLKDSYNKEHPTSKITSTDAQAIWSDLKSRMSSCSKEDCWLDVIKDPNQRQKLDKELFSPDMPKEWKSKPNTWLSNFDIIAVLKQYEESHSNFKVIGPTPIDFDTRPPDKNGKCVWQELCTFSLKRYLDQKKTKIGVVFNLDKHDQGGSHWVSLFLDLDHKFLFFLDSAGEKMPKEVKTLVERIVEQGKQNGIDITVYENHPTEHQMGNTECGVYSLFFIITMLTSEAEGKKFNNAMEKIRFFKHKKIPDKYVEKYRKIYFNE